MVVFLEMLRAVFCFLFLTTKLPKPRRYTSSSLPNDSFTTSIKASTDCNTEALSIPVFFVISFTISALVISLILVLLCLYLNFLVCDYVAFQLNKQNNLGII